MSFFSNAVRFVSNTEKADNQQINGGNAAEPGVLVNFEFATKKYSQNLVSLLIIKPLSRHMAKILVVVSYIITGFLLGSALSAFVCLILLQFGSVENSVISTAVANRFEKMLPDTELSIKSASLQWNNEKKTFDINLQKIKVDDFFIHSIIITPDYIESVKKQRLVVKDVDIIDPKIIFNVTDNFENVFISANTQDEDDYTHKIQQLSVFKKLLDENAQVKLINANIPLIENDITYNLKNLYCEYMVGEKSPRSLSFSTVLPGMRYNSNVKIRRSEEENRTIYHVKVDAFNPLSVYNTFSHLDTGLNKLMPLIRGYNLPVSGTMKLTYNKNKFSKCEFDLSASAGTVRLLNDSLLALTLGKRIDGGTITGTISSKQAVIDSISMSYGDSGVHLSNLCIPMKDFVPKNGAAIDGALSITNISVQEMCSILPDNISKSVMQSFKNCMPEFKLELFKMNLKGPVRLGENTYDKKMEVGDGIFKIQDAKVPVGKDLITNINATGTVTKDGLEIKLTNARFRNMAVSSGGFFLSNKDKSWIGNVKATLPIGDISKYANVLSDKLLQFPLHKLRIKGIANLNMKLKRTVGDKKQKKEEPFRIVACKGSFASNYDNTKIDFSKNNKKLTVLGDITHGKDTIKMKIEEDFVNKIGKSSFDLVCKSDFLRSIIPITPKWIDGDVVLNISSLWNDSKESFKVTADLKGASMSIPIIGSIKRVGENGSFKTEITKIDDNLEFSDLALDITNTKITGKISSNTSGDIKKCVFDNFNVKGCAAKLGLLSENKNDYSLSIVGDNVNIGKISSLIDSFGKTISLTTYINLKEVTLSALKKLRNVKGNIKINKGNVIGGVGSAVYGKDSTLAVNIKQENNRSKDSIVSISASDVGELIKYFDVSNCIKGGAFNFTIRLPHGKIGDAVSGRFEITDFMIENSIPLNRLISLSSPIVISGNDLALGCNAFVGNVIISDSNIAIRGGRLVSPVMAFTVAANYDRKYDDLNVNGLSLYISSLISNRGANGAFAAEYNATGSINSLSVSTKTMKFTPYDKLYDIFGDMLPIPTETHREYPEMGYLEDEDVILPLPNDNAILPQLTDAEADPFANSAFDRAINIVPPKERNVANEKIVEMKTIDEDATSENAANENTDAESEEIKITESRTLDRKTGVIINRGSKNEKRKRMRF
ncbi:hypothetical protein FACS189449_00240 [Alphaproteobacteria bacterium]|nr:hypothetical protein FACS189449_00240 [Alphaproteobacteria bacterium]